MGIQFAKVNASYFYRITDCFRVSAGKFAASNPGRANIVLDTTAFTLSFKVYDSVAKALGVNGKRQAPCNSTMDIIFRAADFDLHITPQDYLKPGAKDDELCDFLANDGEL